MSIRLRALPLVRRLSMLAAALPLKAGTAWAAEVNLYTTREPKLGEPLLGAFKQDTGVKVNTVFVKYGLLERVGGEGEQAPADRRITEASGHLLDLVDGVPTR